MRRSSAPVVSTETCIAHGPLFIDLVRKEGLEPSRGYPLEPKSSASTSSATFARKTLDQRTHPPKRGARSIPDDCQSLTDRDATDEALMQCGPKDRECVRRKWWAV